MITYPPFLTLTEAVYESLKAADLPASLTIEHCANAMAMSMTSFRRKLALEETSYKLIQNKFLNEQCVKALFTMHVKIDDLAIKLGYSERATFERAFRAKFGISPSQFRGLSLIGNAESSFKKLTEIAENMPPMPNSCQSLLREKELGSLDLRRVVEIVGIDPIFTGRIMGQASKAMYGRTPKNVKEAIGRNLGIATVVNFAVVFAIRDVLQEQVEQTIVDQYSQAFLIAPKLFQQLRKSIATPVKFDTTLTDQILIFALLGIFLLSHKSAYKHELMRYSLKGMQDLDSLNYQIRKSMGISIYSASSMMLSLWHIDANVVKQLTHLEKVSRLQVKGSEQDELVLFMLSCLYFSAAGHSDYDDLEQKSELLNIKNFSEIKTLLSNAG